jgi:hypothetical protein
MAATGLADGNPSLGGSLDVAEGTPTSAAPLTFAISDLE